MLVRLLYASRATDQLGADGLTSVLRKARRNNLACGVTGVLCFSSGIFLQALEGGRSAVNRVFHGIAADPRHRDVELLCYDEIEERCFASWSMGQVDMARINPALLLKYSETSTLDPYRVPGTASMALFQELVATASIMGQG